MERSPSAGGCAPDRIISVGSSESEVHLLSANRNYLGEGIIKDVSLLSDLTGFNLRSALGPKVFLVNESTGDLEAQTQARLALVARRANGPTTNQRKHPRRVLWQNLLIPELYSSSLEHRKI